MWPPHGNIVSFAADCNTSMQTRYNNAQNDLLVAVLN